jgi:hypothetical protein
MILVPLSPRDRRNRGLNVMAFHDVDYMTRLSNHTYATSFAHSVLPFYGLAAHKITILNHGNILEVYESTNPFVFGSFISIVSSLSVFVISLSTGNWSWYDILFEEREC